MKKLLLLLLLFPAFTFAQSLTGKWASEEDKTKMVEFKADGTMMFIDPEEPDAMEGLEIKYKQTEEDGKKYLTCDLSFQGEPMDSQKNVYKLEGDKLTIIDNPDEAQPGKSPENVYLRVKP
ncbi:hypothetical protein OGH69_08840 [Flavobacterium sp. MFBS3-15]|uniref:hypothetical protein n=1 Tax=Flavobacterium sp. MFBS3-15 TaxID=2989816 RepID=UPI002236947A|nr:hypothetical protein [Flavobacterium sp. MFBS3-15]MCW4469067.1 hypothetical protein [Flavobacterium sp. MFBS3-15]